MPTRRRMLRALLMREDLLPSAAWPWTTAQLHGAYCKLLHERHNRRINGGAR